MHVALYTAKHVPFLNEGVWSVIFHLDKFVRLESRDLAVITSINVKRSQPVKKVPLCVPVALTWGDCFVRTAFALSGEARRIVL